MYYKALGYVTHHVAVWYLRRRMPAREQVVIVVAVGATTLLLVGAIGATTRSRRFVPTV